MRLGIGEGSGRCDARILEEGEGKSTHTLVVIVAVSLAFLF